MRRHAQNAADGDDAGAADAGDDDVVGLVDRRQLWIGQHRQVMIGGDADALLQLGAVHRDEGRAKAFDAGEVLVAARLIDQALAAPLVSSGCTETQFDCTPQSPQPSQTSSLMMTRLSGSGNVWRCGGGAFPRHRSDRRSTP